MAVVWPGPEMEGSSGGDVGAVGEPTPTSDVGHVTSGRDMGAETLYILKYFDGF